MIAIAVSKISTFPGGFFNRNILLHIRAEGDQDSHGNGQGVEHLPHGGDDGHPGEILKIRHQEIFDAFTALPVCVTE